MHALVEIFLSYTQEEAKRYTRRELANLLTTALDEYRSRLHVEKRVRQAMRIDFYDDDKDLNPRLIKNARQAPTGILICVICGFQGPAQGFRGTKTCGRCRSLRGQEQRRKNIQRRLLRHAKSESGEGSGAG